MFESIDKEAVLNISENTKFAIPGQLVALLGVMYILKDNVSLDLLLMGFVTHIFLMASRVIIRQNYAHDKKKFLILYSLSTSLSGIAWGCVLFFIGNLSAEYHLLLFAIFIGLVSGALFTLGEVFYLYMTYSVPILGMSIVWFFSHGDNEIYKVTGYLGIFAFFYYISAAKKYNTNFVKALYEKKEKEKVVDELKEKSNIFELLFEHSVMGALIIEDGKFVQCNQKSVKMIGASSKEELLNITPDEISPQYQSDGRLSSEKAKEMIQIALDEGKHHFEWLYKKVDGKLFLADVNMSSIMLNAKRVLYVSWRDITEEKKLKNNLKHLAHHDSLTNLPNRVLFNDRLEQAIIKSNRSQLKLAVFFIDLDKFKPINDSLGHEVGDDVLIKVSRLLRSSLRDEDTLARIGGDEFTIIMENIADTKDVTTIADKLIKALHAPVVVGVHSLDLSLSIGISIYPQDADNAKMLLKLADEAMYDAKDSGRDNYKFYTKGNS